MNSTMPKRMSDAEPWVPPARRNLIRQALGRARQMDGAVEIDDEEKYYLPDEGVPAGQPTPRETQMSQHYTPAEKEIEDVYTPPFSPADTVGEPELIDPLMTAEKDIENFAKSMEIKSPNEEANKSDVDTTCGDELLDKVIQEYGGNFDIRGPVGQRFQKEHKPGSEAHRQYQMNRTHAEKKGFRENWCKLKYEEAKRSRSKCEKYTTVDANTGTYQCFAMLVVNQGLAFDRNGAIQRAKRYAMKCIQMGAPWTSSHELNC